MATFRWGKFVYLGRLCKCGESSVLRHKHKIREVTHNRSNHEYYLITNCMHQESVVHLCRLQAQFCYARVCFVLSETGLYWNLFFSIIVNFQTSYSSLMSHLKKKKKKKKMHIFQQDTGLLSYLFLFARACFPLTFPFTFRTHTYLHGRSLTGEGWGKLGYKH